MTELKSDNGVSQNVNLAKVVLTFTFDIEHRHINVGICTRQTPIIVGTPIEDLVIEIQQLVDKRMAEGGARVESVIRGTEELP